MWFSVTSENELLEEYNNFAVYYKLITQKNNELNSISKIVFSFINRFSTSLIVFDGADDLSIDFLSKNVLVIIQTLLLPHKILM